MLAVFLGIWEHPEVLGGQTEVWVVTTLLFLSATRDHVWRRIHPDHPVWSSCRCSDPQVWLNLLLMNRASFRAWSSCLASCVWRCSYSVLPAALLVHVTGSNSIHCSVSQLNKDWSWISFLRLFWTKNVTFMSKHGAFNPERTCYLWVRCSFFRKETKAS